MCLLGVVANTCNPALGSFGRRISVSFEVSLGYISITRLIVYTADIVSSCLKKKKIEKGEKNAYICSLPNF